LYPYPAILEVVRLANHHHICILGMEIFQILPNGFLTEAISDHGVKVKGEWTDFCARNNAMASEFIDHHRKDKSLGYILTTASREEYKSWDYLCNNQIAAHSPRYLTRPLDIRC
jgi:hypothetical protein